MRAMHACCPSKEHRGILLVNHHGKWEMLAHGRALMQMLMGISNVLVANVEVYWKFAHTFMEIPNGIDSI